jgi:hypothetical protein
MNVVPRDVRRSFRDAPVRRIAAELYCFYLTFRFHPDNDDIRKFGTLIVVGVWGAIEVGNAFDLATPPDQFFYLRLAVGVLIGRVWGIEINNFAGIEFSMDGDSDGDD